MKIGEKINLIRKHLELTQAEFGEKIGLKPTAISQMESGTRSVTERTIILICEKYNVNEEWLRTEKGDIFILNKKDTLKRISEKYKLDTIGDEIIRNLITLDESDLYILKEILDNMVLKNKVKRQQKKYKELLESESIEEIETNISPVPDKTEKHIIELAKQNDII